jgi:bifunctional DNase/RNase
MALPQARPSTADHVEQPSDLVGMTQRFCPPMAHLIHWACGQIVHASREVRPGLWFRPSAGVRIAASGRIEVVPTTANLCGAETMSVQMELSRIIISEINDQQVVYLKEVDGDRTFPILIGLFEATSIDRRVKHHQSPRPLTHDLLVAAVELMGGEFQDVVISEIKEHTYYAVIRVAKDGDVVEIDARPSDAIAVAVTCEPNLPIYVAEEVLENVLG